MFEGLTGTALPLVLLSAAGGLWSVGLLAIGQYRRARWAAAGAVAAVMWGWAAGQYPCLLVDHLTIAEGAGASTTLIAMLVSLAVGAALVVPALVLLLTMTARGDLGHDNHLEQG